MKKFIVTLLLVVMMVVPFAAFAQESEALWALSTNQHVTGILTPMKIETLLGPQNPPKPYIRGFLENGLVREKGLQRYIITEDGHYYGLTAVATNVIIFPQYKELVDSIVLEKCGYTPDSVMDYIFATMYFYDNYVGHMFFRSNIPAFYVGDVIVNKGKDSFKLYLGDWDEDGKYDLGFAAGWTQCKPKPEPEPEPDPIPVPKPEPVKKTCKKTCTPQKVCAPVFQFNLFSIVKNCFKR